jgi:hypothetical protein
MFSSLFISGRNKLVHVMRTNHQHNRLRGTDTSLLCKGAYCDPGWSAESEPLLQPRLLKRSPLDYEGLSCREQDKLLRSAQKVLVGC